MSYHCPSGVGGGRPSSNAKRTEHSAITIFSKYCYNIYIINICNTLLVPILKLWNIVKLFYEFLFPFLRWGTLRRLYFVLFFYYYCVFVKNVSYTRGTFDTIYVYVYFFINSIYYVCISHRPLGIYIYTCINMWPYIYKRGGRCTPPRNVDKG